MSQTRAIKSQHVRIREKSGQEQKGEQKLVIYKSAPAPKNKAHTTTHHDSTHHPPMTPLLGTPEVPRNGRLSCMMRKRDEKKEKLLTKRGDSRRKF